MEETSEGKENELPCLLYNAVLKLVPKCHRKQQNSHGRHTLDLSNFLIRSFPVTDLSITSVVSITFPTELVHNYHLKIPWPTCLGERSSLFTMYGDDAFLFLNCRMRDDDERDREITHAD